jgi:hypothetical protein
MDASSMKLAQFVYNPLFGPGVSFALIITNLDFKIGSEQLRYPETNAHEVQ